MSKRLDSLNSPTPTGGLKSSLKFKPKAVARKSEKERAKDAPKVKTEPVVRTPASRGRGNGRGRGRGGRFNYEGTHMVFAGPLSAGSVSLGNANGSKTGLTSDISYSSVSPTPEFIKSLKLKERPRSASPEKQEQDSDDDVDAYTNINMTDGYRFADEETVLFPVRPERDDRNQDEENHNKNNTPVSLSNTPSLEPRVKSEPLEDKMSRIHEEKIKLETKITEASDNYQEEEASKLLNDYQQIVDMLTTKVSNLGTNDIIKNEDEIEPSSIQKKNENTYFTLQLPKVLPKYVTIDQNPVKVELEEKKPVADDAPLRGQIGHINIHQSGKVTINIGNDVVLSVSQGAPANFLQELVIIQQNTPQGSEQDVDMINEDGKTVVGDFIRLGEVENTIIATPLL